MSFADELRRAPQRKEEEDAREEQKRQRQYAAAWNAFLEQWYLSLKEQCLRHAEDGYKQFTLHNAVLVFGRQLGLDKENPVEAISPWAYYLYSRVVYKFPQSNGPARSRVYLCEADADAAEKYLRERFQADGLQIDIKRREIITYHHELEEQFFMLRTKRVKDGVVYDMDITLRW